MLESTPPNIALKIPLLATKHKDRYNNDLWAIPTPRLELHCERDDGPRRFDPKRDTITLNTQGLWNHEFLHYTCRDCAQQNKTFAVLLTRPSGDSEDLEVIKLGEYPPFSAPISNRIAKLLDKADLEMYRKGTRSEAQGLGIGAATYFRRIVESQWQLLITEIRQAAEQLGVQDLTVFDKALTETQFSSAVDLLKGALPPKLLILGGENPLTLLYQPLSLGLHGLTDEQCLQQAADIRLVLTALLENIADVLKDQNALKEAAARLRQPRP
jgi:hypothetical protein